MECPLAFSLHHCFCLEEKVQYLEVQQPYYEHEDECCPWISSKGQILESTVQLDLPMRDDCILLHCAGVSVFCFGLLKS